jgi:hypothetical protein
MACVVVRSAAFPITRHPLVGDAVRDTWRGWGLKRYARQAADGCRGILNSGIARASKNAPCVAVEKIGGRFATAAEMQRSIVSGMYW